MRMSLTDNKTAPLWQDFMSKRRQIPNAVGSDLYSLQIYEASYFNFFNPAHAFEKWAATAVNDFEVVPAGMETLVLPSGWYAVFLYKGPANQGQKIFQYIFEVWLPTAGFLLDDRPHFELLGEKYKNNDPDSEEEIWIPVRLIEPETLPFNS